MPPWLGFYIFEWILILVKHAERAYYILDVFYCFRMFVNKLFANFTGCFHMNINIYGDFENCISAPLMSKNIVTKPFVINSIEVWMSKYNFLIKWFFDERFWNHQKGVYNIKIDSAMRVNQNPWEQTWEVS